MTATNTSSKYKTNFWLSNEELSVIYTSEYWNNREVEKSKAWWNVLDGNFDSIERYLQESHLLSDLIACLHLAEGSNRPIHGVGADLAAGILWSVPHLLTQAAISKLYCVEMSQHRLFEIGPQVLKHYGVPGDKVELCLGSFYDIKLPDKSLDFVVLISAFHHADDPDRLLQEIYRVLKLEGIVLIVGEHKISKTKRLFVQLAKLFAAYCLPKRLQHRLFGKIYPKQSMVKYMQQLQPVPDPLLGDHYYFLSDYQDIFTRNGFEMATEQRQNLYQYFVIWPQQHQNEK